MEAEKPTQYATFYLEDRLFGIDVQKVQEVTDILHLTPMRSAERHIRGLINLRGQIATAIGMRELMGLEPDSAAGFRTVVCAYEGCLLSLIVDKIGDVLEVSNNQFEPPPANLPSEVLEMLTGVYKLDSQILSVVDVGCLLKRLNRRERR